LTFYLFIVRPSVLFYLPMVCVKSAACPIGDEAQPKATDTLLPLMPGSAGAMSSPSCEGSPTDATDSDSESRSVNFDDELSASDLDLIKRAKVAAIATAVGMTFNFGASNVGKAHIQVMGRVSYFAKGHARPENCAHTPG
jgi:hypothetical protein